MIFDFKNAVNCDIDLHCIFVSIVITFFQVDLVSWYQIVIILDFIGAKDGGSGGNNWSYMTSDCHHPQTNTQLFTGRMPFLSKCHPTNIVKH